MFHCSSKLLSRTFHTSWTSDAWEAVHKLFLSSRSAQKHPEFTTIWSPAHMLRWWHAKDRHGPTYNADQWPSSGKSLVLLQETTESFQLRHLSLNFNCDCKCWAIFQANEGICGAGSLFNAVYIITSALPHVARYHEEDMLCIVLNTWVHVHSCAGNASGSTQTFDLTPCLDNQTRRLLWNSMAPCAWQAAKAVAGFCKQQPHSEWFYIYSSESTSTFLN